MPLYEFHCGSCGRRFESLVRLGKEKDVCCEVCNSQDVRKIPSSFGIGGGGGRLKTSSSGCSTCSNQSCSTCN
ncbi:MAG: zinc ribbon domain-containing protein [Candidatus Aminicenantes bacterium]|nr:zinc ribbon domain-containing protein [Candidatus Aminicenantes bacterium]